MGQITDTKQEKDQIHELLKSCKDKVKVKKNSQVEEEEEKKEEVLGEGKGTQAKYQIAYLENTDRLLVTHGS